MRYILTAHARKELGNRRIPRELLETVLREPQQIVPERMGRSAYQSQLDFGTGKIHLLRAIVDDRCDPPLVVTAYKTSKISKYWRPS